MTTFRSGVITVAALALLFGPVSIAVAKTFSFPHVLEVSGSITASELNGVLIPRGVNLAKGSVPKTLVAADTEFDIAYYGGLPGAPATGLAGATVDLYLYDDETGDLIKRSDGQNACGPCTFNLSSSNRKVHIAVDDYLAINATLSSAKKVITGYAIATVSNDDANVNMVMRTTVNTGKGLNLAVFVFQPQELQAAP